MCINVKRIIIKIKKINEEKETNYNHTDSHLCSLSGIDFVLTSTLIHEEIGNTSLRALVTHACNPSY
jgi:hypothetical protein